MKEILLFVSLYGLIIEIYLFFIPWKVNFFAYFFLAFIKSECRRLDRFL